MKRSLALVAVLALLALPAQGADRVHAGKGSFPRWRALSFPTGVPLAWLVAVPPELAAIDREGSLWILEVTGSWLRIAGHWGAVGSPEGPPVAVRLGGGAMGVAFPSRDGRLALWWEGSLREMDVGTPLSPLTSLRPVDPGGSGRDDLLALGKDGALLLIGGLPSAPRTLARLEARALPDARIAVGDLDRDGVLEAVVLSDPTRSYRHGILGDQVEAGSLTVAEVGSFELALKGRYGPPSGAVFEERTPVMADLAGNGRQAVLLAKSHPRRGAAVAALGWDGGHLVPLAEAPALGAPNRWTHVLGAADLDADGIAEVLAVKTPHIRGVLTAYHRKGAALAPVARAPGYSSHAVGSRNQEQAAVADLDGNGRPEVILPRQSRDALAALELAGGEFVERWAYALRGRITSNVMIADLDGDGLLDLAVADAKGLHVLLSSH